MFSDERIGPQETCVNVLDNEDDGIAVHPVRSFDSVEDRAVCRDIVTTSSCFTPIGAS